MSDDFPPFDFSVAPDEVNLSRGLYVKYHRITASGEAMRATLRTSLEYCNKGALIQSDNMAYTIKRLLDHGAFGAVFEVADACTPDRHLALKIYYAEKDYEARAIEKMKGFGQHPNVLLYPDPNFIWFNGNVNLHVLPMELMDGSLYDVIHRPPFTYDICLCTRDKLIIINQIAAGLGHIHRCGLIHTDLKMENVLLKHIVLRQDSETLEGVPEVYLEDIQLKIGDFGNSVSKPTRGLCQTPPYRAPEVIAGLNPAGREMDLWSLGVLSGMLIHFHFLEVLNYSSRVPKMRAAHLYFIQTVIDGIHPEEMDKEVCEEYLKLMASSDEEKRASIENITRTALSYKHKTMHLNDVLNKLVSPKYEDHMRQIIGSLLKVKPSERWSPDMIVQVTTAALNN